MSPGAPDTQLLCRHLMALDFALTRLERHSSVLLHNYSQDLDLQWAVERGLLVATQNVLDLATHLAASAGGLRGRLCRRWAVRRRLQHHRRLPASTSQQHGHVLRGQLRAGV